MDFEVPVNIAINLPSIAQMAYFLIVNTIQKSVDKSVEQRIIARLSDALDVEDLPSLPNRFCGQSRNARSSRLLNTLIF